MGRETAGEVRIRDPDNDTLITGFQRLVLARRS